MSSLFLFTLYTNDCRNALPCNLVIKFSDDTVILSLLYGYDCPTDYHSEIVTFRDCCKRNYLILNTTKTKETIFDPRTVRAHESAVIDDMEIEHVGSYKYIGIQIDNMLKWNIHVDCLCARLAQRLHFPRRLRLFGVSTAIVSMFYNAALEGLIRYGMAAWFGFLSVQLNSKIGKMVNTAIRLSFVLSIFNWQILKIKK